MTSSSPQSGHGWLAPLIVTVLITLTILTWLDKWLYSNEVFNNLSMGLSYSPKDPLLVELKEQALHYCTQYATDSELKECNIYQDAITDDLYFAHPLTALIGLQARKLLDNPDSWTELHRIALEPPLIGIALALPLWFLLCLAIPRSDRTTAVGLMFLIIFIGQCHDREWVPIPDLIHNAGTWLAPLTLIAVVVATYLLAARSTRPGFLPDWAERFVNPAESRNLFWLALAIFALSAVAPPSLNVILAPLGLAGLVTAVFLVARRNPSLSPVLLACIIGLLFAAITSEPRWVARKLGTASGFVSLLYMGIIALVSVQPRSRLVWVFPLLTFFHAPLTALLGLATVIAELVLKCFGSKTSNLIYPAALSFLISITVVLLGFESTAFAPGTAKLSDLVALALHWPGLLPAFVSLVVVGLFTIFALRGSSLSTIAIARAGLLILQGLGAALISAAVLRQDPALLNAPGYAMFAKPAFYITNTLLETGSVALLLALGHRLAESEAPSATNRSSRNAMLLVSALLLLTATSKLDMRLRNSYAPGVINLWRYVVLGEFHPDWCRHLRQANFDDETYYLSKEDPTNDAAIYWSALKARVRIDRGVAKPESFKVLPAPDNGPECQ